MAALKTQADVPGPSPLQEQLFFAFLLFLMLICFFRAGCAPAAECSGVDCLVPRRC